MKEIDFPSHKKDWNEFEKKTIALNILYVPHNTEEIRHAYKSKHNLKRENQVILLMITDCEKWHYLAAKKLSALFKGIIIIIRETLLLKLFPFMQYKRKT